MFPQKQYPISPPALTPPSLKSVFVLGPALIVSLQLWEGGREGKGGIPNSAARTPRLLRKQFIYFLQGRGGRKFGFVTSRRLMFANRRAHF